MIAQIEAFRPDVILNQVMHFVSADIPALPRRQALPAGGPDRSALA